MHYRELSVVPDFSHSVLAGAVELSPMPSGTQLVKLYDRASADTIGPHGKPMYDRQDFNPTVLDDDAEDMKRGRFSSSRSASSKPPYEDSLAYMYVATYRDPASPDDEALFDEAIAVWEILEYNDLQVSDWPTWMSEVHLPAGYAFSYLETTEDFLILELCNARTLQAFLAEFPGGVFGPDHVVSRQWGRYFRREAPLADGFAYESTKFGSLPGRYAYVLYERGDHVTADNENVLKRSIVAVGPPIDIDSPEGLKIVGRALGPGFLG